MPKTKFQSIVFTAIMVFFMVYCMTVYTISMKFGGLTYKVFALAIQEMWVSHCLQHSSIMDLQQTGFHSGYNLPASAFRYHFSGFLFTGWTGKYCSVWEEWRKFFRLCVFIFLVAGWIERVL